MVFTLNSHITAKFNSMWKICKQRRKKQWTIYIEYFFFVEMKRNFNSPKL